MNKNPSLTETPLRKTSVRLLVALGCLTFMGACEHAKFSSDHGGPVMPWATPEGFENSGAGTPLGMMGGMQGR